MENYCPHCSSTNTYAEYHPEVHMSEPRFCEDCKAHEYYSVNDTVDSLRDVEIATGWRLGEGMEQGDSDAYPMSDAQIKRVAAIRGEATRAKQAVARELKRQLDEQRREQEKRDRYRNEALF